MKSALFDDIERRIFQFLMSLPLESMLKRMGQAPVVIDGRRMHPEIQFYLFIRKILKKPDMSDHDPVKTRLTFTRDSVVHGIKVEGVSTSDHVIKDDLQGRLYFKNNEAAPVIVFYHGGGFVLGDNDMYDNVCRYFCDVTGHKVFAVDYSKAPERPFPASIDDSVLGYKFLVEKASEFQIDVNNIVISGDSAGGNIATVVTQILASENYHMPKKQLLIYPTCDWLESYQSTELFGSGFFLTKKDFIYFGRHYHGNNAELHADFRISPLRGKLSGLPETIIVTAGFDPLRDQGDAYAMKLREAGVKVVHIQEEGMIHGFINFVGFSRHAREATLRALSVLKIA